MKRKLKIIGSWILILQTFGFIKHIFIAYNPSLSPTYGEHIANIFTSLFAIPWLIFAIWCLKRSLPTEESKQKKEQDRLDKIEATKKAQTATTYEWSIKKKK